MIYGGYGFLSSGHTWKHAYIQTDRRLRILPAPSRLAATKPHQTSTHTLWETRYLHAMIHECALWAQQI